MSLIVNGTLSRVDAPASVGVDGLVVYASGDALDVDVTIDAPTSSQRFTLGARIADVSAVVYVLAGDLPAGVVPRDGSRVVAALEDCDAVTYQVVLSQRPTFDELTHYQLFCKVA